MYIVLAMDATENGWNKENVFSRPSKDFFSPSIPFTG